MVTPIISSAVGGILSGLVKVIGEGFINSRQHSHQPQYVYYDDYSTYQTPVTYTSYGYTTGYTSIPSTYKSGYQTTITNL